ncbi:hypothetical protein ABFT23_12915 [Nocardioides sp. C4-1]|uniref:hypothetical protein n=1 Tax=Nocardioides sp. C4-1 TaxID=3151851 RepID=UPI0032667729
MELHDHLYALGLQAGRDVLRDPAQLRAALASSEAAPADVDLVVEALRRGTVDSFVADLDSGVDPAYAVQTAGSRLAQHTGAAPADASWAIAVLGFALGRVGENDVRRHRAPTSAPDVPHTQLRPPSNPGTGRPPAAPPAAPPSAPPFAPPPAPPGPQPYQGYAPQPAYPAPPPGWPPPPAPGGPSRKSPLPIVLAVLGTLVAIVAAVVLVLVLTRGDDDDTAGDPTPTTTSSDGAPTTDPTASDPTATDLTSPPAPGADAVSFEDATAYTSALTTWSDANLAATMKLNQAAADNDTQAGLQACRSLRAAYYDFDLAVRSYDLTAVQPDVNEFLTVSGEIIEQLDQNCAGAKAPSEILRANSRLPTTEYATAFTDLTSAITDSAFG